ncbi:unnamed protein product [Spirodela intermedia]|uniref:Uncharacterized protein n=1 Tax=Spirodela intermedia TaxID=51605 RepID=A0A7I8JID2_SPIIN|nr:unnamed protein product [Spirodela intermedia]CAA6669681.1 unnamed protein product [Spirodela intermedia]
MFVSTIVTHVVLLWLKLPTTIFYESTYMRVRNILCQEVLLPSLFE